MYYSTKLNLNYSTAIKLKKKYSFTTNESFKFIPSSLSARSRLFFSAKLKFNIIFKFSTDDTTGGGWI